MAPAQSEITFSNGHVISVTFLIHVFVFKGNFRKEQTSMLKVLSRFSNKELSKALKSTFPTSLSALAAG